MEYQMNIKSDIRIGGVIPPIITPLNEDYTIDEKGLKKVIDNCIKGGVHGIFVLGSAGEGMNFNQKERNRAIKTAVEHVGNRVPLFCGVLDTATAKIIDNIKAAEQMGAKYVVATPSFYYDNVSQNEIVRHFEQICNSTRLKVISYNLPGLTHVNMLPETILEISKIDNLIAHKESYGNWEQFQNLLFILEDKDFPVITGGEELIGVSILFGSKGCVPCGGSFYPKLYVRLYELAVAKKVDEIYKYQKTIAYLGSAIEAGKSWISGSKYIGKLKNLCKETVSLPIEPLEDSEKNQIEKIIKELDIRINKLDPELL